MEIVLTCSQCGSGVEVFVKKSDIQAHCKICQYKIDIRFGPKHEKGILSDCPCCHRKDFYSQKDFNRKVGVTLFIIAAILSIWTYGLSLAALYLLDLFLFRKLPKVAVCYKCQTVFRKVLNIDDIRDFNHEMNDRIVYSDHDFGGHPLEH